MQPFMTIALFYQGNPLSNNTAIHAMATVISPKIEGKKSHNSLPLPEDIVKILATVRTLPQNLFIPTTVSLYSDSGQQKIPG